MSENKYTESEALALHGITGTGDTLTDNAREAGVIYVCLGCGTVGAIDPSQGEIARQNTRDYAPEGAWECCVDADTIIY